MITEIAGRGADTADVERGQYGGQVAAEVLADAG
jgi:hypothetical protein